MRLAAELAMSLILRRAHNDGAVNGNTEEIKCK